MAETEFVATMDDTVLTSVTVVALLLLPATAKFLAVGPKSPTVAAAAPSLVVALATVVVLSTPALDEAVLVTSATTDALEISALEELAAES